MEIILTQHGRKLLNKGKLIAKYYKFFDDEVDYQTSPGDAFSTAFTPASLGGLHSWWHADLGISAVSGYAAGWADQSGNGNDLTQTVAGNRPLITSMTVSGRRALYFDPLRTDFLEKAAVSSLGSTRPEVTFFAAVQIGDPTGVKELLSLDILFNMRLDGSQKMEMFVFSDAIAKSATSESSGNLVRTFGTYNGGVAGTSQMMRNGVLTSDPGTTVSAISATPAIKVGGRGVFFTCDMRVRTLGIYNRVLNSDELSLLDSYLLGQM